MKKQELAIFGGEKTIKIPHPHWKWPVTSEEEIKAVEEYMRHGKKNKKGYPSIVEEFERNFADYHKTKYALTTNSGTSALHSAFFAIGLGPGDEILAPTFTFFATCTPIMQVNAIPVLCDCEPETANIDPGEIKKRITDRTKAIVITHLWGHPCDMDEIKEIAEKNNLALIEDCSHAHGAKYKGQKVGTFGDIACFSMDSNKMMAAGEAGVLITNKKELLEKALLASDFGPRLEHELTIPELKKYNQTGFGCKYRINPIAAVIANEKLKNLEKYIKMRKEKLDYLSKGIEKIPGIAPPVTRPYVTRGAFYGYKPFFKGKELNNLDINVFIKILQAEGMDIRLTGTPPLHLLPLFNKPDNGLYKFGCPRGCPHAKSQYSYKKGDLPVSERFYDTTLSLPTFTLEQKNVLDKYIEAFRKVCSYFAENKAIAMDELNG